MLNAINAVIISLCMLQTAKIADSAQLCDWNRNLCACRVNHTTIDCNHIFYPVVDKDKTIKVPLRSPKLTPTDDKLLPQIVQFRDNVIDELNENAILPNYENAITQLDFTNNRIASIGVNSFVRMEKLEVLKLTNNKLSKLTRSAFSGGPNWKLRELYLDYNPLTDVEDIFTEMPNLKKLVLDGVTSLDLHRTLTTTSLSNLKHLSLRNCGLSDLPNNLFDDLTSLETLSLSDNPLTVIPIAVRDIPSLKILNISNTLITKIQKNAFQYDEALEQLWLAHNPYLYGIHQCAFCGLQQLKELVLRNCTELYHMHESAFTSSGSADAAAPPLNVDEAVDLRLLDVQHANLSLLPQSLQKFKSKLSLKLGGNPWNCSCWMIQLLRLLEIDDITSVARCAEPSTFGGRELRTMMESDVCGLRGIGLLRGFLLLLLLLPILTVILVVLAHTFCDYIPITRNIMHKRAVTRIGYVSLDNAQSPPHNVTIVQCDK